MKKSEPKLMANEQKWMEKDGQYSNKRWMANMFSLEKVHGFHTADRTKQQTNNKHHSD